jgi:PAS domain S-box-containing protein
MRFFRSGSRRLAGEDGHLLRALADSVQGLVVYVDRGQRCRMANAMHRDWYGLDPAGQIGQSLTDVWGERLAGQCQSAIGQALKGDVARIEASTEVRGAERHLRGEAVPDRGGNGQIQGAIVVLHDVTDEQRARLAVQDARAKAVAADDAKSRFLAGATHDLRQPIHALNLFASALGRRVKDGEAGQLVKRMQGALDSLTRMFNALLDLSKIDSGLVNVEPMDVRLNDVLARIETEFGAQAAEKRLQLRVMPSSLMVRTDPILLENILRNLVGNALKFTKAGSILVGVRRSGAGARIEVHDSGPGIAPERIERIFEPYERSRQSADGPNSGLGLGLAIVQKLAGLLGFKVTATSKLGFGSALMLHVPAASIAVRRVAPPSPEPQLQIIRNARVIIIDDDDFVLDALGIEIADLGAAVSRATSTGRIMERLETETWPDLMIVDYQLQAGRTALDFLDEIGRRFGRTPPVILVTGSTENTVLKELEASGLSWLIKPVPPDVLRREMARAISAR